MLYQSLFHCCNKIPKAGTLYGKKVCLAHIFGDMEVQDKAALCLASGEGSFGCTTTWQRNKNGNGYV
jgi:hypothetical protein